METLSWEQVEIGSAIYAVKPGDGSAREQAASCQRVLGGLANICQEYATKRYRSNLINWGILPFQLQGEPDFTVGDYLFIPGIRRVLEGDLRQIRGWVLGTETRPLTLFVSGLNPEEREILKAGSLINCNRNR
jgi:aconitate hydratase